jgi:hypothetical protein
MADELSPENQRRIDIILSGQAALVGSVGANLRVVQVTWKETKIHLYFIYDGKFTNEDEEECNKVAERMQRDFSNTNIEVSHLQVDYPQKLPTPLEKQYTWLYARREAPLGN